MRILRAGFLPVSLLILLAAAMLVPLPFFLERPGRAVGLADCVRVDHDGATPVAGDYLLMTISVAPASAVDMLVAAFDPETIVVGQGRIVPQGVDPEAYFRQQREEFVSTADVAAAVGLQAAGLPTEVTGDGVSVISTVEGTPAAEVLESGDIITEVNGDQVAMADELPAAIASVPVGDPLTLRVQRRGQVVEVDLAAIDAQGTPVIGIIPETVNPRVTLPVAVDVASGSTGGPSAGLTIALTVYDQVLPGVDLAAGRVIAGTGSIDHDGRVGPIGGAGLKVLAALDAGASVFLVPAQNHAEAVAALPQGAAMDIVKVATFDQARAALEDTASQRSGGNRAAEPRPCPYDAST